MTLAARRCAISELLTDSTKAFISYMRSVHLQKDKTVFDVSALPADAFAASLGLPGAPQIKLLEKGSKTKARGPAATPTSNLNGNGAMKAGEVKLDEISESDGEMQREVVGSSESEGDTEVLPKWWDDLAVENPGKSESDADTGDDVSSVEAAEEVSPGSFAS